VLARHSTGKELELLRAVVPGLMHLAVIRDAINPAVNALGLTRFEEAAGVLAPQIKALDVASADELASAFALASPRVIVGQSALFLTQRTRIAELAAGMHLAGMYQANEFVEAGGLMSYGTSNVAINQGAAIYIGKMPRGARPADLPVEQLTTVDFASIGQLSRPSVSRSRPTWRRR
jgi:putative ABC transport system substrate-binding protein